MERLRRHYQACFDTLGHCKNQILAIMIVFIVGGFFGWHYTKAMAPKLMPIIKELIHQTAGLTPCQLSIFIFSHNTSSALIGIISGLFFGFFPIIHALSNGLLIGFVLHHVHMATGSSHWWKLVPHGIFELPAIFMSLGLGVYLGQFWFCPEKMQALKSRLAACLKTFVLVILPLIIVAAIIEGHLA